MVREVMQLSDDDRNRISELIEKLKPNFDEILDVWVDNYFQRGLKVEQKSKKEIREQLSIILRTFFSLENGNFERYFKDIYGIAKSIVDTGLSYENVIGSVHIYEMSIAPYLLEMYPDKEELKEVLIALDQLSHNIIAIFAESYYERHLAILEDARKTEELERKKLNSILDNVDAYMILVDKKFKIIWANEKLLNRGAEGGIIGESCHQVIRDCIGYDCNKFLKDCPSRKTFKTGGVHSKEVKVKSGNGGIKYLNITATPVKDEDGRTIQTIELIQDITKRKEAEEKLKEYANKLERTNELRDIFTDIMRHDLLNPVGIIKNLTELLLLDEKDDERRGELNRIKANAIKLIDMIEDSSKLAKLDSVEELKFEKMDLGKIMQTSIQNLQPKFEERGIKIEYNAKDKYEARVNERIEDVFSNLLSNAIKYSPEKGRVVVDILDKDNDLLIMVKDSGRGVPDDYKNVIFERFEKGGKTGVKGSGLGLAIVKRIVDLHNGKVWVEDNPEGGSIFCVVLPKTR